MYSYVKSETPAARTLADALKSALLSEDLKPLTRRKMASSVKRFAWFVGKPLEAIPADLAAIRTLFEKTSPAQKGRSPRYWAQVKCMVMKALRLSGVKVLSGRCRTELPPNWARLIERVHPHQRRVLLPFVRYCIEHALGPCEVDQKTFDNYEVWLDRYSSRANRRNKFLALCRIWNACGKEMEDWPQFRIAITLQFDRYMVPAEALPNSFHRDVAAMIANSSRVDLLSPRPRRMLRRATVSKRKYTVYRAASACIARGVEPASLASIADLAQPEVFVRGLEFILERAGSDQPTMDVFKIAETMHVIARDHAKLAPQELAKLRLICANLRVAQTGMTEKNRKILRCFEDEKLVAAFLGLPGRIARRLMRKKALTRRDAIQLQLALAIELLIMTAIRVSNLASIRFDKNLLCVGSDASDRWHLVFSRHEVKNDVDLEFELDPTIVKLLELYLRVGRPKLCEATSQFLFPGGVEGHKQAMHLSSQLSDLAFREIGVRVTAHQYRHLAGFFYLRAHPGCYEHVRQLLGHNSIFTTMKFYAGMERSAAITAYDNFILARRRELGVDPSIPAAPELSKVHAP